jgi:hypothetical protein
LKSLEKSSGRPQKFVTIKIRVPLQLSAESCSVQSRIQSQDRDGEEKGVWCVGAEEISRFGVFWGGKNAKKYHSGFRK